MKGTQYLQYLLVGCEYPSLKKKKHEFLPFVANKCVLYHLSGSIVLCKG
jgi:hypothetical protein